MAGSSSTAPTKCFPAPARELDIAPNSASPICRSNGDAALALEPSLRPCFNHAVHWTGAVSVTNPLALTRAYVTRFAALGGLTLSGDARTLHRVASHWRVDTRLGPLDAGEVVIALGPWAPDLLGPLGIRLPLAVKRGYHRHFHPQGNAALGRPVLDAENGYCFAPMEQGIRITTGAEFAARDAAPTPVQFDRVLPPARELFPLGEAVEPAAWLGSRPCFADFTAGDRARAAAARPMARLWAWSLGFDAWTGHRPVDRRDDDRRDAVLRSGAIRRGEIYAVTVIPGRRLGEPGIHIRCNCRMIARTEPPRTTVNMDFRAQPFGVPPECLSCR